MHDLPIIPEVVRFAEVAPDGRLINPVWARAVGGVAPCRLLVQHNVDLMAIAGLTVVASLCSVRDVRLAVLVGELAGQRDRAGFRHDARGVRGLSIDAWCDDLPWQLGAQGYLTRHWLLPHSSPALVREPTLPPEVASRTDREWDGVTEPFAELLLLEDPRRRNVADLWWPRGEECGRAYQWRAEQTDPPAVPA